MIKGTPKRKKSLAFLLFFLLALLLFQSCSSAQYFTWMKDTSLESENGWKAELPDIVIQDRYIYVVWHTWITELASLISFKMSSDAGKTWSETLRFTSEESIADSPKITCQNNFIYIVWKEVTTNVTEIFFKSSSDYGKTWNENKQLTYNNTIPRNIYDVKIETQDSMVFVIWKDYRTGSSEVFLKKSDDYGETWSQDIRVTKDYTPSYHPAMAIGTHVLWIVWDDWGEEAEICSSQSYDFGNTWSDKQFLTSKGESKEPCIAIEDEHICLVWMDDQDDNFEIYFKESSDNGMTWSDDVRLTNNSGLSASPQISMYNDTISIVWMDDRSGHYEIFFKQRSKEYNWTKDQQVTHSSYEQLFPALALLKSYPCIVWKTHFGASQSDINFTMASFDIPLVLSLYVSDTTMDFSESINLEVYGIDQHYSVSELNCEVQLKSSNDTWIPLHETIFIDDHWEQVITFTNTSSFGEYPIRARLSNPEGKESAWSEITSIELIPKKTNSQSPGFEIIGLIVFMVLFVFIKEYGNQRRKPR